ncbi:DUF6296 family protein [Kitasatospora sp. NPDC059577]|uniref:DUF6296 family protein n=1 Tax=Kitasatospora sp. NPDC059577 TaxID=3346873 RepID=UPI0036AA30FB
MSAPVRTSAPVSGYLLRLRGPAGTLSTSPVAATGRFGPAGHPLYTGCEGRLLVEISAEGSHRVIARPADTRILTAEPCASGPFGVYGSTGPSGATPFGAVPFRPGAAAAEGRTHSR